MAQAQEGVAEEPAQVAADGPQVLELGGQVEEEEVEEKGEVRRPQDKEGGGEEAEVRRPPGGGKGQGLAQAEGGGHLPLGLGGLGHLPEEGLGAGEEGV